MSTVLRTEHLSFAYGAQPVLTDLDVAIPRGALLSIVGPNGSGKTTLVRLLAGLLRPKGGRVLLHGRDLHAIPPRELARQLAFVPQDLPSGLPFTVRQTVLMARAPHQGLLGLERTEDLDSLEQAMRCTGVADLHDRQLDQLSGGEHQRVFIARALCQEADIMLLDEPTAALDYAYQLQILELLERLCRERHLTVILVSHDLNLTSQFADRVLVLHAGRAVACGDPKDVLRRDVLENVYGCRFTIDTPHGSDRPHIMPRRR